MFEGIPGGFGSFLLELDEIGLDHIYRYLYSYIPL